MPDNRQTAAQRGYGSKWQKARAGYLAKHPLCAMCQQRGVIEPATVVDHIKPHRNDMKLFWDSTNWQALCSNCHSSHKQRLEKSGNIVGCTATGQPLDPRHHWHTGGV